MSAMLRMGAAGGRLAEAQCRLVARRITARGGPAVATVAVTTSDERPRQPARRAADAAVTALREALLRGEVDAVVRSFGAVFGAPPPGVRLAAVPEREDPRDALVWPDGGTLKDLPANARVGTGSPHRSAQILLKLDRRVVPVPVDGDVDARLELLRNREVDALVLAMAGLTRLGLADIGRPLAASVMVPAPAQGALAVECREDDVWTAALLRVVDHPPTRARVLAEYAFLAALDTSRAAPVGALALPVRDGVLRMEGLIAAADGSMAVRQKISGSVTRPGELGRDLAASMLRAGGAALLDIESRTSKTEDALR